MTVDGRAPAGNTRREWLRRGAAAVAGVSLLAGCAATGEDADSEGLSSDGAESTPTGGWTASLAPAGEVRGESVPRSIAVYDLLHADMAVAYGAADAVNSLGFDAAVDGATLAAYYERLDGVDVDWDGLTQLNDGTNGVQVDAELLYELDSDLHLIDPALVTSFEGWERTDVETIGTDVAPWIGNYYGRTRGDPPGSWAADYEYYTLWEVAERVAPVFDAEDRFGALASVRHELVSTIETELPPPAERPTVAMAFLMDGTFYPTAIDAPGYASAHVRPFGVTDALADDAGDIGSGYGYEAMLKFDPDVLLVPYGLASYYSVPEIRETLAAHPVGREITAVDEGRVYPSGVPMQGPIVTLFQTEMTAKQLFPDRFGTWPDYDGGPYPKIPEDEWLFDRDRVAEVVRTDG